MDIKFLHTADWHLGAILSYLPPDKAQMRRDYAISAISQMVSQSLTESIDIVLISGDIFETPKPSEKLKKTFFRLINPIISKNIPIFIIPGNHDYYKSGSFWDEPEFSNLNVFRNEGFSFINLDSHNLTVWGVPTYKIDPDKNWLKNPPGVDVSRKNILLHHGDYRVTGREYDSWHHPFDQADLPGLPFEYIALGHHHSCKTIEIGNKIKAAYPGTPFGWTFRERERGSRFYIIGKLTDSGVEILTRELKTSLMRNVEVNIDYPSDIKRAFDELESFSSDDFVRIVVKGSDEQFEFVERMKSYGARFKYFSIELPDVSVAQSEIEDNYHLSLILEALDERLRSGEIDTSFHERVKARTMELFRQ